jgi:hypothetical protein
MLILLKIERVMTYLRVNLHYATHFIRSSPPVDEQQSGHFLIFKTGFDR